MSGLPSPLMSAMTTPSVARTVCEESPGTGLSCLFCKFADTPVKRARWYWRLCLLPYELLFRNALRNPLAPDRSQVVLPTNIEPHG